MIPLTPPPEARFDCPRCQSSLQTKGWLIPGMRALAELGCVRCGASYYGDLPVGQAIYTPTLLDAATGDVYVQGAENSSWFAEWLRLDYLDRAQDPVELVVEEYRAPSKILLLNCLDRLYGHSLLKLLNAQHHLDHRPDLDLVLLVPHFLRWMVPEGAAAVWTVHGKLARSGGWNDQLASMITQRCEAADECWLSSAISHPNPADVSIERFTGVAPFELDRERMARGPRRVTFVWREDRLWSAVVGRIASDARTDRIPAKNQLLVRLQRRLVVSLAERLRSSESEIDFAVVGYGSSVRFPEWIGSDIVATPTEQIERRWCRRYSSSHVVVGVHGSNMLLPSAHAAAVLELVPEDRWGNLVQDLLLQTDVAREALSRYRNIPSSVRPRECASIILSLLQMWRDVSVGRGVAVMWDRAER